MSRIVHVRCTEILEILIPFFSLSKLCVNVNNYVKTLDIEFLGRFFNRDKLPHSEARFSEITCTFFLFFFFFFPPHVQYNEL
jgi:hypothetical protein